MTPSSLVTLEELLKHEFGAAQRYRRFLSLVTARGPIDDGGVRERLASAIRDCDVLFDLGSGACVVMTGTSREGALAAVERFGRLSGPDSGVSFRVATFPGDGSSPQDLMMRALRDVLEPEGGGAETRGDGQEFIES